eukprot:TRINITY_DN37630_c0_g1_i2.p1 TRINITY_DN37630_c0_g1~~TRINITY_DN37630_c0_g1_i2.p1  ORF type:complete len:139 (-),score=11.10 TRINITY_DN37630_c0_g1_i2:122-538(-)
MVVDWSGMQAISGCQDCRMHLWDLGTLTTVRSFVIAARVRRSDSVVALAADWFDRRAVSCTTRDGVKTWDLDTGACLSKFDWTGSPICPAAGASWSLQRVLSCHSDRRLRLWDLESRKQLEVFEGHSAPVLAVAADWD